MKSPLSALSREHGALHFFGLTALLIVILAAVMLINYHSQLAALKEDVQNISSGISSLQDKVKLLELKIDTRELQERPVQ